MRNFVQIRGDFEMRIADAVPTKVGNQYMKFETRNEKSTMKLDKRAIFRQPH